MGRIEKTVFLSYRRTNFSWAQAIFADLTHHGYDVFFDFNGIASGDFERVIIENIKARAHFLVLLTPSALGRCGDPGDWLRREIETALATQRNIVPLMLDGFDFGAPGIASELAGTLAPLQHYNALRVPAEYFDAAMQRLREKYLSVALDAVLHAASPYAQRAAKDQQAAAGTALSRLKELTAKRGFSFGDLDEWVRSYTEAIRLEPDDAGLFYKRGNSRYLNRDLEGALLDYNQAIRLKPDFAEAFSNRGNVRFNKGDFEGALQDLNQAIRLKPDHDDAFIIRGNLRHAKGDLEGAQKDYNEGARLRSERKK